LITLLKGFFREKEDYEVHATKEVLLSLSCFKRLCIKLESSKALELVDLLEEIERDKQERVRKQKEKEELERKEREEKEREFKERQRELELSLEQSQLSNKNSNNNNNSNPLDSSKELHEWLQEIKETQYQILTQLDLLEKRWGPSHPIQNKTPTKQSLQTILQSGELRTRNIRSLR
jgi:hypothetical protein